ncbi:MAG: hypothetical protein AAFV88_15940, partial [Planctomycetota bacterium]
LGKSWIDRLSWSRFFVHDWILGSILAVTLMSFRAVVRDSVFPKLIASPIRLVASCTFAMYLLHYPLLVLTATITSNVYLNLLVTFSIIVALTPWTEGAKPHWRQWVGRWMAACRGPFSAGNPE